jgi:catechol 2,3-dioxygenase-like lactoylglutathione lyase family enzyme
MKSRVRPLPAILWSAAFVCGAPALQAEEPPHPAAAQFSFVRLHVKDIDQSIAFYNKVLGLHEIRRLTPPTVPAVEVFLGSDDPKATIVDLEERTSASVLVTGEPNAGSAVFCFTVENVAAATKLAASAGGRVVMPGGHVVWSHAGFDWSVVDDPDGNHIELLHHDEAPGNTSR